VGSLGFISAWVAMWGFIATGSGRSAWAFLLLWLKSMAVIVLVSGVLFLIARGLMPSPS
jgi:hypothetical protein